MPTLRAEKPFPYGRAMIAAGDQIEASESIARVLEGVGFAKRVGVPPDDVDSTALPQFVAQPKKRVRGPDKHQRKRRRYKRRDMVAE